MMIVRIRSLLALVLLAIMLPIVQAAPAAAPSAFIPLPGGCGGVLPPGVADPACCMFGYVFIDGQAVEGAKVTIASAHGTIEVWTRSGPDSPQPYYRTSLSDSPLSGAVGDTITVKAEYSSHTHTVSHTVLSGGQQVDVVLPRNQPDDYVFDRQIWQQAQVSKFNSPFSVAVDGSGSVYVVDQDNARIQVFDSSGAFLRQWGTLGGQPGQFVAPSGVAVDSRGNVYVADTGNLRIQRFTSTGTWLKSWGSDWGTPVGYGPPVGITVDSANNVYVTDNFRIKKFSGDGALSGTWGGTKGTKPGEFDHIHAIAIDSGGNFYVADILNHRIQKRNSSDGSWVAWGSYGSAPGQFTFPSGVAIDASGNLYVTDGGYGGLDSGNHRIQKFTNTGTLLASWGGKGSSTGKFGFPEGLAVGADGSVYVADTGNHRIQKFSGDGTFSIAWGQKGRSDGQFADPAGLAVGAGGRLYVADMSNYRLQVFAADGAFLECWGPTALGCRSAQLNLPYGIALDAADNVYVTEQRGHRVQKFSSAGAPLKTWGAIGSAPGQFNNPQGIAVAGDIVYVADNSNRRIQTFSPDGAFLSCWSSSGPPCISSAETISSPVGLAAAGSVYVTDSKENRILKFSAAGVWEATWGGLPQSSDPGKFREPQGIALDGTGNVYVADRFNNRIQKFSGAGTLLAAIGARGGGPGQLNKPYGVAVGGGKLYVADTDNNRIEVFRPMTFDKPIATIVKATPRSMTKGQIVTLRGIGGDSDASPDVTAYEWTRDGGAPFATTAAATLDTSALSLGSHTIAFRVRDTEGVYSDPQTVTIEVSEGVEPSETWTFLLYLDGDNTGTAPYLDRDTPLGALYRLEHTAPNPNVRVVALIDGPRPGGGDSFRYIQQDDGTFVQEALGEVNMGDPEILVSFVRWGQAQAPADHYYLAIADHANGIDGIAWDYTTVPADYLSNADIRRALIEITEGGSRPIDVLHFDGCLMGLLDNAYQVHGLARYLVASENLAWSAFAYERYRAAVGAHTSPSGLAQAIADRYAELLDADGSPYTIAALDLGQVGAVAGKVNALAGELQRFALAGAANRAKLLDLWTRAQKLDSNGSRALTIEDEYVDLDHWASLVQGEVGDAVAQAAAATLRGALPALVLHERHRTGSDAGVTVDLSNARGLGIYYPRQHSTRTYGTYVHGGLTFPTDTLWDEFLAAGLTALPVGEAPPGPQPVAPLPLRQRVYLPLISR